MKDTSDNKPLSLEERWQFDVEDRGKMLRDNPLEAPAISNEEIEHYRKEFNIDIRPQEIRNADKSNTFLKRYIWWCDIKTKELKCKTLKPDEDWC